MSKFSDFLFGKKQSTTYNPDAGIRSAAQGAQAKGIELLMSDSPDAAAKASIQRELMASKASESDALRSLRDRIAQMGMGKSSVGLSAETGARRKASQERAMIQTSLPERLRNLRLQRAQALMTGGSGVLSTTATPQQRPARTGGMIAPLMTLAGAGIGSMYGQPGLGAQLGAGVGYGLQGYKS